MRRKSLRKRKRPTKRCLTPRRDKRTTATAPQPLIKTVDLILGPVPAAEIPSEQGRVALEVALEEVVVLAEVSTLKTYLEPLLVQLVEEAEGEAGRSDRRL